MSGVVFRMDLNHNDRLWRKGGEIIFDLASFFYPNIAVIHEANFGNHHIFLQSFVRKTSLEKYKQKSELVVR